MNKTQEALKMAIEFMEETATFVPHSFDLNGIAVVNACKAALFEPEQVSLPDGWVAVPVEVLNKIKNLPRYNFLLGEGGNSVRKWQNESGTWIERYDVIYLLDDYMPSAPKLNTKD